MVYPWGPPAGGAGGPAPEPNCGFGGTGEGGEEKRAGPQEVSQRAPRPTRTRTRVDTFANSPHSRATTVESKCFQRMGQGEVCPRECRCWNSIYDADSKVIIGTASAGLGLIANRALERDEIIAGFGKSIILRGRAADEAHELIINFNTMRTVGRGLQYSIRRKLASETTHSIVMPSADRFLALSQRGISPDLHKALNQGTGSRRWANLANHICCARHHTARLEVLSVANTDIGEYDSQDTGVVAVLRANRFIPVHDTILTCYRDTEGGGPREQMLEERRTLARLLLPVLRMHR